MSTLGSDWPPTPDFHPEFGFLCLSPRRRRRMRLALTFVMAGMAIGATMELALAHWRDKGVVPSAAVRSVDEELTDVHSAIPPALDRLIVSPPPSASAAEADGLLATRPQEICKKLDARDLAAAFLNPRCRLGTVHAHHGARTTYGVATVIVGRTDTPPTPVAPEPPAAVKLIESSQTPTGTAGKAASTAPVERPAPSKKPKAVVSAPIVPNPPTREPAQQEAGARASAAMSPARGGYFERPEAAARAAALPPSVRGPFGGIW
jgi:hypothetical protein